MIRRPYAVTLSLLAAACSAPASDRESEGGPAEPPSAATPASTTFEAAGEPASWTLTSNGVTAVQAVEGRGSATPLMFGAAQANVVAALTILLGKPRESDNAECGAGPIHTADFGPLKANFQDGRFVGWLAQGGAGFETTDGIEPGVRFASLERDHRAQRIEGTTLDGEFELVAKDGGTIGGFVDAQGRVASLHAGVTCFFR